MTRSLPPLATPLLTGVLLAALLLAPAAAFADERGEPWPLAAQDALSAALAERGLARDALEPRPAPPALDPAPDGLLAALSGPAALFDVVRPWAQLAAMPEITAEASQLAFLAQSQAFGTLGVPLEMRGALGYDNSADEQLLALGAEMHLLVEVLPELDEPWIAALAQLTVNLEHARLFAAEALAELSPEERQQLLTLGSKRAWGVIEGDPALTHGRLLDQGAMARGAGALLAATDAFLASRPTETFELGWQEGLPGVTGQAVGPLPSAIGDIYIGGPGPNTWEVDAALILELGGNDVYRETGSAPLSGAGLRVVLDLGGADRYEGEGPGTLGGAAFGLALLRDLAGNDRYLCTEQCQGAGWFGAGILLDEAGDDIYVADTRAQGAAAFGIGLLADGGGHDIYTATAVGQGAAGPLGAGLLVDRDGDDGYRLLVGHGQGATRGVPSLALPGGFALLWDAAGTDHYRAERSAQGRAAEGGLGLLIEGAGDDSYRIGEVGQACATGPGAALLLDLAGLDTYVARQSAQGAAGPGALALLVDHGGANPVRCTENCAGSAQGGGVALRYGHFLGHTGPERARIELTPRSPASAPGESQP